MLTLEWGEPREGGGAGPAGRVVLKGGGQEDANPLDIGVGCQIPVSKKWSTMLVWSTSKSEGGSEVEGVGQNEDEEYTPLLWLKVPVHVYGEHGIFEASEEVEVGSCEATLGRREGGPQAGQLDGINSGRVPETSGHGCSLGMVRRQGWCTHWRRLYWGAVSGCVRQ
ncbi:hypothetical protein NDU88_003339 [Pleurodeles waltl]|uniref:Uncharacterized protein n=1 Tax=Pleurodeles waltl TaxID=8319 RepID=A0AAV7UY76_PLEWA|nr:hypothetical protein NDU88_003339 [Pleurodeles waltl]